MTDKMFSQVAQGSRLRVDSDDLIPAASAILDNVEEAFKEQRVPDFKIYPALAATRREIERVLDQFGQRCLERGRRS